MEIGLHVPQVGPFADKDSVGSFAKAADDASYDGLWVFEYVAVAD